MANFNFSIVLIILLLVFDCFPLALLNKGKFIFSLSLFHKFSLPKTFTLHLDFCLHCKCLIFVLADAPQILPFYSTISQPQGTTLVLTCNTMAGSKPFRFVWYKNGQQLDPPPPPSSSSITIESSRFAIDHKQTYSVFSLYEVVPSDSANYTCMVFNEIAFDSQWSILQVKG